MNHEAFGTLYRKQFDCVFRYAVALTGNHSHAEEITQEAFARLLRDRRNGGAIERPEAWLMRVARNLAIQRFRENVKECGDVPIPESRSPEQLLYHNEVHARILTALSRLGRAQRECIALREFGGLRYQEIAEMLEISVDQVKVQLFRARQNLKRDLEDLI
jgi:RNA polymerase sigma-70 factor (ECF subfamily)